MLSMTTKSVSRYMVRGDALRSVLAAQGRRKDWLAAQAGISPSLVSHALAGRRTVGGDVAERMAAALQVPIFLFADCPADHEIVVTGHSEDAA